MVSLTATIPPDYALQDVDYLCNGSLKSNTTVVLEGGEHRISTNCTISNISNVTIIGSSINNTTIRRLRRRKWTSVCFSTTVDHGESDVH